MHLCVSVEPPQIKQSFVDETFQPGPSVFLKCVASGNPTPEITWELDGKRLSNTERLQVGQYVTVNGDVVSHLNISSIHTNDGGLYKCIAASKVKKKKRIYPIYRVTDECAFSKRNVN